MNLAEKVAKALAWLAGLFVVLAVVSSCVMLLGFHVRDTDEYNRLEQTAVQTRANITRITEYESDEGKDYRIYITFVYDGTVYRDVYYKTVGKEPAKGTAVTVWIDPDEPTNLRPDKPETIWLVLGWVVYTAAFTFLIYAASIFLAVWRARRHWPEHYASGVISSELVREDILFERTAARRMRLLMAAGLVVIDAAGCTCHMAMRGTTTAFTTFMPLALFVLLAMILLFRVKDTAVELLMTTYEGTVTEKDSDGDNVDRLRFTGIDSQDMAAELVSRQGRTWEKGMRGGMTVFAAMVKGKPVRFYPADEFRREVI